MTPQFCHTNCQNVLKYLPNHSFTSWISNLSFCFHTSNTRECVFFSDNSHYIGYNGTFICLDSFSCDANKCIIPVHDNEWGYIYWSFHLLVQCIYVCVYVIMHCLFIFLFIHYIIWYIKLLQAKCTGMLLCKCLVLEGFSL